MNGQDQRAYDDIVARIAVLEAQMVEREKAMEKALDAAQLAVDKAESGVTNRLEGFPQIYLTRNEADVQLTNLVNAVQDLRDNRLDKDYYIREHASLVDRVEQIDKARHEFVTQDKYDDKLMSEAKAREAALLRVDEKFDEYVKRYDQRQREVDLLLAAQKGATEEAKRAAETTQYKANRNIAIAGALLTAIIVAMNIVGGLVAL